MQQMMHPQMMHPMMQQMMHPQMMHPMMQQMLPNFPGGGGVGGGAVQIPGDGKGSGKTCSNDGQSDGYTLIGDLRIPEQMRFDDDERRLSTTYASLGMAWHYGKTRTTVKKFRASLITACNSDEFPMVRMSQLTDEQTDILLFVLTGVGPNTKVCDLGCTYKKDARKACRSQYIVRLRRNASRLSALSEELDNLGMIAIRLGYAPEWFSPELKGAYDQSALGQALSRPSASSDANVGKQQVQKKLRCLGDKDDDGVEDNLPSLGSELALAQPLRDAPKQSPLKLRSGLRGFEGDGDAARSIATKKEGGPECKIGLTLPEMAVKRRKLSEPPQAIISKGGLLDIFKSQADKKDDDQVGAEDVTDDKQYDDQVGAEDVTEGTMMGSDWWDAGDQCGGSDYEEEDDAESFVER